MVEPVAGQGAAAFGRERLRSAREAPYTVRLGWGEDGVAALAPISQVLVVVDVITFSTAVAVAVERGATVHPHPWDPDAAAALARRLGGTAAVSRSLVSASNPFSLSPATLDRAAPGAVIVLPSPNGSTLAAAAAKEGCMVLAGSLRNAAAVARLARRRGRVISVIAAGERWSGGGMDPAVEDLVGAGAVVHGLRRRRRAPEASAAVAVFRQARRQGIRQVLAESVSGREMRSRGYGDELEWAAALNVSAVVPVLRQGAFVGEG